MCYCVNQYGGRYVVYRWCKTLIKQKQLQVFGVVCLQKLFLHLCFGLLQQQLWVAYAIIERKTCFYLGPGSALSNYRHKDRLGLIATMMCIFLMRDLCQSEKTSLKIHNLDGKNNSMKYILRKLAELFKVSLYVNFHSIQ